MLRYSLWSSDSKLRMADRSPCFDFQTFHKMWFSLRRYRSKKSTSSSAMILIKFFNSVWGSKTVLTSKTLQGRMSSTRFNVSKMFSGCQIGQAFVTFIFSWIKLFLFLFFFFKDLYILNISFFFCQIYEHSKLKPFHSHGAGLCHKFQLDFDFYDVNFYWFMCCQMCDLIS